VAGMGRGGARWWPAIMAIMAAVVSDGRGGDTRRGDGRLITCIEVGVKEGRAMWRGRV
jgi:hypothetical protein